MFRVEKTFEVAGSHRLCLNYDSKCQNQHGHNWIITIYCQSRKLDENGMVVDFTTLKEEIHNKIDHKHLNKVFDFNPTAENIARWITDKIPKCYKAKVEESEGNVAIYEI